MLDISREQLRISIPQFFGAPRRIRRIVFTVTVLAERRQRIVTLWVRAIRRTRNRLAVGVMAVGRKGWVKPALGIQGLPDCEQSVDIAGFYQQIHQIDHTTGLPMVQEEDGVECCYGHIGHMALCVLGCPPSPVLAALVALAQ